jgi:hypothetical protein
MIIFICNFTLDYNMSKKGNYQKDQKANLSYDRIFQSILQIPVIDCHEHLYVPSLYVTRKEPIAFLLRGYFPCDLMSAGMSNSNILLLQDPEVPTEKKWSIFEYYWRRTEHTAYAREIKSLLHSYGEDTVTLGSLQRFAKKIREFKEDSFIEFFDSLNIKALLWDPGPRWTTNELKRFIEGEFQIPDCYKLLITLPILHGTRKVKNGNITIRSFQSMQDVAGILGETVTSLDEFLDVVKKIMIALKKRGAVGIKDQSAYVRSLDFELATEAKAEALFNKCLSNPNYSIGWPEAKPLDDFLFHQYMRFAKDLDLPVQIHTGHMAGIRNRVDKTNAALFTKVLELHQEVSFDLFHGNWPYMGDLLFLAKNYPNVCIDLCWVNVIDPIYSVELLERAVVTVPHKKVHGFGGDYWALENIPGHLSLAQKNIARALSNLVSDNWLTENEAITIAADWLYNNPNEFFKLGLQQYNP